MDDVDRLLDHSSSDSSILGKSPTSTLLGRVKYPCPNSQKKQWLPERVPLPSPTCASSRTTPTKYPNPSSAAFPTYLTSPLAPFSSWQRCPTWMVAASDPRYSGSHISGCPVSVFLICGFWRRKWCFHLRKLSGSWLQASSVMTYLSTCAELSICLRMEAGFRSWMAMIMPVWTPQKSRVRSSSSMGVTTSPFLFLRVSRMQGGYEPQRFSMFSLRARTVECGSSRSSGMRSELRLCSRSTLIIVYSV